MGALVFSLSPRIVGSRRLRLVLVLSILAYLALHKYIPPLIHSIRGESSPSATFWVPLGISYFTFKLLHFVIDVGRRKKREGEMGDFLSYLFLFPAFTAGPIERWDHFRGNRETLATRDQWVGGLTRIAVGIVKKFAIVELILRARLQDLDATTLATSPDAGALAVWGYLILWYLYVYLDFSAYTDIAIGAARLYGIELMENFRWPIFASNIGDFWKRWHMTLASWCQSYVYLPTIGWKRNPYIAVFATFFVIGIWHGASLNWVLWGLYHGAGVAAFLTWSRWKRRRASRPVAAPARFAGKTIATVGTFLVVAAGFAFSATHADGHAWDRVPVAFALLGKSIGLGG